MDYYEQSNDYSTDDSSSSNNSSIITNEPNCNCDAYGSCQYCYGDEIDYWNSCKTFDDLRQVMLLFIQGKIYKTPMHFGPIVEKDPTYIQHLVKLNEIGAISFDGQEYLKTERVTTTFMQREYISFYYQLKPSQNLNDIITKLIEAKVYYVIFDFNTEKTYIEPSLGKLSFKNNEVWVTKTLNHNTGLFDNHTHMGVAPYDESALSVFSQYVQNLQENLLSFIVWSKTWNKPKDGKYLVENMVKCLE